MSQDILMILDNGFNPDQRVLKEARYLIGCGHRVTILCWDRDARFCNKLQEQIEGILIQRIEIPSRYGSGLRQILPLLKFAWACRKEIKKRGPFDCYHCHDLNGVLAGWFATWNFFKKSCLVFDMKEFYESGNLRKVCILVRVLVQWMQNKSQWIIFLNEQQKKDITKKNSNKLIFLPNYPEKATFDGVHKIPANKIRIAYIGYVRHEEQLKSLICVAARFEQIEVYIHGDGVCYPEIKRFASDYPATYVTGKFDHDGVLELYNHADLLYCVYSNQDENDRTAYPTKLFEGIITQTPLIVAGKTAVGDFCQTNRIGYCTDDELTSSLATILRQLVKHPEQITEMAENMRNMADNFVWEKAVQNLNKIYPLRSVDT